MTNHSSLIRSGLATALIMAITFILTPSVASSTPTLCEFIAVELLEAVDRGDLTNEDAMAILRRCQKNEGKYS